MKLRTGLIGRKVGMTRILQEDGTHVPVTLVNVSGNRVVNQATQEKRGYTAVSLGYGEKKAKKVNKPSKQHFAKLKVTPPQMEKEFRVSEDALLDIGAELKADHFVEGGFVDVTAQSIGKGFAGVMKRHNFGGLRASHGVSISHRSHGSTGQCQDPGRVFKGKKMAGQMGNKQVTAQNIKVLNVDVEQGLVALHGSVPGSKGSYVYLTDAVKKKMSDNLPFPASIVQAGGKAAEAAPQAEDVKAESEAE